MNHFSKSSYKVFGLGLSQQSSKSLHQALTILKLKINLYPTVEQLFSNQNNGGCGLPCVAYLPSLLKVHQKVKLIAFQSSLKLWLERCQQNLKPTSQAYQILIRNTVYHTDRFNKNLFTDAFYRHQSLLKKLKSERPNDILILSDLDGGTLKWTKICNFLCLPTPLVKFPHIK